MRFVIIGTGGAGVSAVESIRRYDDSSEIIMISKENVPPYSPCVLVDYLENENDRYRVFWKGEDFYERMDVTPILGKSVREIDIEKKVVKLDSEEIDYDKLLIAAGGNVAIPPIKGLDTKGVFTFKTLEDADKMHNWLKHHNVEKAVIIGGGFIGLDAAVGLKAHGVKVTIVELLDRLLPAMFDKEMGTIVKEIVERNGVEVFIKNKVTEILGDDSVRQVKLESGKLLDADMVVVATGVRPNIEIVRSAGIEVRERGGIIVNEFMETSAKDVYAAGDVAEAIDIVTGEKRPILLWSNALIQGSVAGYNMVEKKVRYLGSTIQTIIRVFGVPVVSDGHYEGEMLKYFEDGVYKKMYLKDNRIYGYMLINTRKNAGIYNSLMISKRDVSAFKDIILSDKFNIGKIIAWAMQEGEGYGFLYPPQFYNSS